MKIKLDENVPSTLVDDLSALGHDIDTLPKEGLGGYEVADAWPKRWKQRYSADSPP